MLGRAEEQRATISRRWVLFSAPGCARRIAELAAESWGKHKRERMAVHPPLGGGFDAAQALDAMTDVPADGRVLMVGHEPDLSRVAGELTGGGVNLKKGGRAG